jgi:hypothetical protein
MKQTKPTAPVTIASRERFEELIDAALHLAGVVGIVARERHMPAPAASVKFTRNDFIRLRSPNRTIPAERIIDAAEGFAADLVPYGITAATLAEFREKITAAKHGAVAPRVAIGARRAAAALLAELYRETNDLLTHTFDVLMLPLRRTDRSFYTKYQLARTVNQRRNGSRRKSPAGDAAAPRESIPA